MYYQMEKESWNTYCFLLGVEYLEHLLLFVGNDYPEWNSENNFRNCRRLIKDLERNQKKEKKSKR